MHVGKEGEVEGGLPLKWIDFLYQHILNTYLTASIWWYSLLILSIALAYSMKFFQWKHLENQATKSQEKLSFSYPSILFTDFHVYVL